MSILSLRCLYSNSFLFDNMPRVLIYIVVVSMLTYIAHAQDISPTSGPRSPWQTPLLVNPEQQCRDTFF